MYIYIYTYMVSSCFQAFGANKPPLYKAFDAHRTDGPSFSGGPNWHRQPVAASEHHAAHQRVGATAATAVMASVK